MDIKLVRLQFTGVGVFELQIYKDYWMKLVPWEWNYYNWYLKNETTCKAAGGIDFL